MAAHYPKLRPEWWSACIDLFPFLFFFFLFSSAFPLLYRHCSIVHLHPGCRWSWQRLILFVFFCVCLDCSQSDGVQFSHLIKKSMHLRKNLPQNITVELIAASCQHHASLDQVWALRRRKGGGGWLGMVSASKGQHLHLAVGRDYGENLMHLQKP